MAQFDAEVWPPNLGGMLRQVGKRSWWVAGGIVMAGLAGCGEDSEFPGAGHRQPTAEDLLAFNQQKAEQQHALLQFLAPDSMGFEAFSGMRVRWPSRHGGADLLPLHGHGTLVKWSCEVSLTNGEVVMRCSEENPMVLAIGFSEWPDGFHVLASHTSPGDTVEAWLPAARAWGLTGNPPTIPQDAIIGLRFKVISVESPEAA